MTRDGTTTALLVLVSGLLVISLLSPGIGTVSGQGSPEAAYFHGNAVTEDGTNIPSGTTIKAVTEDGGSNRTVDEITMDTDGEYGGAGLGEVKLEVPGNVDGEVYFIAETGHGSFTAQETVQNPPAGQQQFDLTFPVGSAEPRPYFEISGLSPTDKTAIEGESVDVSATVDNIGSEQGTQTVTLDINGSTVETRDVTLGPGSQETVEFSLDTASLGAGNYTHGIASDDNGQTGSLTVESREASFTVSELSPTETTVVKGDTINASATVTNEGNAEGTETVTLQAGSTTLASQDVTLSDGAQQEVTFTGVSTNSLAPGTYTHGIYANNDSQTGTLTVESRQAAFTVSELDPPGETITVGAEVAIAANVTNDGNSEGTQTVTLQIDGQQYGSEAVTLAPDDQQSVAFSPVDTSEFEPGTYTYTVASDNDSQSGTLVVESDTPAAFRVTDMSPTDRTVSEGATFEIQATVRNDGDQTATQQVQYRIDGETVARQGVSLASGDETTVEFTGLESEPPGAGTYTHGVYTRNDSFTGTLTIDGPDGQSSTGSFTVSEMEPASAAVASGDTLEVSGTISNEGSVEETQSIEFRLAGDPVATERVTLGQSETTAVSFTAATDSLAVGTYAYGIYSDDDEQVGTLAVENETAATPTNTTSATPTPTPNDDGGGLIPDGLLRALLYYVVVPLVVIYAILKALAIYLGY
ncbi:CARDB domain-containing protein [Salinibaculum rarum]|uniref:CARDB domain-containing protein n=1 Tax=Salinibaculum rarum TaxID=3058903 RepID=UPI00265DA8E5|nr:CARDB domain-containing protein [Salinibaculum sp. KK48]